MCWIRPIEAIQSEYTDFSLMHKHDSELSPVNTEEGQREHNTEPAAQETEGWEGPPMMLSGS